MEVKVLSKRGLKEFINEGFYDKLSVISFYEADEKPIKLPDDVKALFVKSDDLDRDELKYMNIGYSQYLPESDKIAGFILEAYKEDREIICQCNYGQSISAGCAAAVVEYFDNDGIRFFSDYRFCPNQLVFHKIYNALKRNGGRHFRDERFAYISSRRYKDIFIEKFTASDNDYTDVLDFLADSEEIIADRYGEDSVFMADIHSDRGLVLSNLGQYKESAVQYEKAAKMYSQNSTESDEFYVKEQLARALMRIGETAEAINLAKEIWSHNEITGSYLLADIYSYMSDYPHALSELQKIIDNSSVHRKKASAVCEIGHIYSRMGNKAAAIKYLSEAYRLMSEHDDMNYYLRNEGITMFD